MKRSLRREKSHEERYSWGENPHPNIRGLGSTGSSGRVNVTALQMSLHDHISFVGKGKISNQGFSGFVPIHSQGTSLPIS